MVNAFSDFECFVRFLKQIIVDSKSEWGWFLIRESYFRFWFQTHVYGSCTSFIQSYYLFVFTPPLRLLPPSAPTSNTDWLLAQQYLPHLPALAKRRFSLFIVSLLSWLVRNWQNDRLLLVLQRLRDRRELKTHTHSQFLLLEPWFPLEEP